MIVLIEGHNLAEVFTVSEVRLTLVDSQRILAGTLHGSIAEARRGTVR